jgi:putative DNA primase/helicase
MSDFPEFVRSLGLRPRRAVSPDGKIHRCPTAEKPKGRNGAYFWAIDGRMGWAQDWATMDEPATWTANGDTQLPEVDHEALRKAWREQERKTAEAIRRARAYYDKSEPLRGGHPYLDSHDLDMTGCYGLRVDRRGWLVIPARKSRHIMTVQRVSPEGDKRFFPGAPVSGTSYRIEGRKRAAVTVICEGLATGLALFRAVPHCRVIVAWHTGNLAKVEDIPTGLATFAADNDHGTEATRGINPGIKAAKEAAEALGCGFAYPEGIQGTDWSDYRQERVAEIGPPIFGSMAVTYRRVDAEIAREIMASARFVS